MTIDVMRQIVDLLSSAHETRSEEAPTPIKEPYFQNESWCGTAGLQKNITVVEHDIDQTHDDKWTYVLFIPNGAIEIAKKASSMFADDSVQLEVDFTKMNKGVAKWQVGHVGVSDFAKQYWPLVYIVAQSEKESSVNHST